MKITSAAAVLVLLLTSGCGKSSPFSAFRGGQRIVPPKKVTVTFDGLVVHVLAEVSPRAVIPRFDRHNMKIEIPVSSKTDVQAVFPQARCSAVCTVLLEKEGAAAFRIVKLDGQPVDPRFFPDSKFSRIVTPLSAIEVRGVKPFGIRNDFDPDVFAAVPSASANGKVAGWFELAGGDGTTKRYGCPARYDTESDVKLRDFPATVTVTFENEGGLKLQVLKPGAASWNDAKNIALQGAVTIRVNNDKDGSNGSHFQMYGALSRKQHPDGNPLVLPAVIRQNTDCTPGAGPVPGCSNSAWP